MAKKNPPPVVVDWYPSPKVQQPELGFAPAPGQAGNPGAAGQWGVPQAALPANPAQSPAGVPQAWILVPANGYYTGQAGTATTPNPAPGTGQQATPWNGPAPQSRIYYLQQAPQQTYSYPQQPTQQPNQYPLPPWGSYGQRPWGQYNESTTGGSRGAGTGQPAAEPPSWGSQGYGGSPVPGPGYYGGYPGPPLPGYGW